MLARQTLQSQSLSSFCSSASSHPSDDAMPIDGANGVVTPLSKGLKRHKTVQDTNISTKNCQERHSLSTSSYFSVTQTNSSSRNRPFLSQYGTADSGSLDNRPRLMLSFRQETRRIKGADFMYRYLYQTRGWRGAWRQWSTHVLPLVAGLIEVSP